MKAKFLTAALASIALTLTPLHANAQQWAPPPGAPESAGLNIVDSFVNTGENSSLLMSLVKTKFERPLPEEVLCEGYGQGDCDFTKHAPSGVLLLPACTEVIKESCIASVSISTNGETSALSFVRQTAGPTVVADSKRGLPYGSTVSLWESSASGERQKFAVYSNLRVTGFSKGKYQLGDLGVTVMPYSEISGSFYTTAGSRQETGTDGRRYVPRYGGSPGCAWTEQGVCGQILDLDPEAVISVTVVAPKAIGGWFRGRMKETGISVAATPSGFNSITVSGKPVEVPMIGFSKPKSELSDQFMKTLRAEVPGWSQQGSLTMSSDVVNSEKIVAAVRGELKDTASGTVSVWSFVAAGSGGGGCLSDTSRVLGIVTTNATWYQRQSPQFTKGFLDYQVAGMHYLPDGQEEFLGTYDLVMRSDVARCLYRFSKAPLSASISVSGEGDKNIATTVVGEKGGWLKLAAYGFTFSNKTIKVKLTQKKQTTITCVAPGKKAKKVTAVNPKCPKGFKKR